MPHIQFSLPVWGPHLQLVADFCLPSLLAPKNLPAILDGSLTIQTDEAGKAGLERHPIYGEVAKVIRTSFEVFDGAGETDASRYARLSALNRRSMERALEDGAACVPLIPDVVYANGSIEFLQTVLASGKRLALMTSMRATIEHAQALNQWRTSQTVLNIAAHDLVKFGMYHCHPVLQHCTWGNPFFSSMPYMVLFPVEGEGFIGRTWTLQPAAFFPKRRALGYDGTIDNNFQRYYDAEEITVLNDSGQFLCCELAPSTHFMRAWEPFVSTPELVGHWAKKSGFSKHNWENFGHHIVFRCTDTGTKPWFDAKTKSDEVVDAIRKVAGHG